MTFAAVGATIAQTSTSFSLTPAGVGHLILLEIENNSAAVWATGVSSSNVTWSQMGTVLKGTTNSRSSVVFAGTVTAASAATVTVTLNGSPGTFHVVGHEFSSTVGSWALDGSQANLDGAGTNTWPALTPTAGAGELYFGYAIDSSSAVAGSTSGYTYANDGSGNGIAWNASCPNSATSPAWGDSGSIFGVMVLVKETGTAAPAPFYPARQAIRAKMAPPPALRSGAVTATGARGSGNIPGPAGWHGGQGSGGAPVRNPSQGPPVSQGQPAGVRAVLLRTGSVRSTAAAPPVITAGPQFRQQTQPVRARLPLQPFLRGRTGSSPGSPPRNPSAGPAFLPFRWPVQAADPLPRRGRITGISQGAPPRNPAQGPVFAPVPRPARAPVPQVFSKGRAGSNPGGPARNPSAGPAFRQAVRPAQARTPLPPRGRTASNPGGPVQNPVPGVIGPPFYPFRAPARIRPSLPPRGHVTANPGAPVRNPAQGAALPALHGPVRARQPLPARGRTAGSQGAPVQNPAPPAGPQFRQQPQPARAHAVLPVRGRASGSAGIPVPQPPAPQPPVQHGPARARIILPARGRTAGNPCAPVTVTPAQAGPPFRPRRDPARARIVPPPRGRASGSSGTPPRNPAPGPAFRQATSPIRSRIPRNAPRGRTSSNPGGPVANIPAGNPLFRLGSPYFRWQAGTPGLTSDWAAGSPVFAWTAGVPETSA